MSDFDYDDINEADALHGFGGSAGPKSAGCAAYYLLAGAVVVMVGLFLFFRSCGEMVPITVYTPYDIDAVVDGKRVAACTPRDNCPSHPGGKVRVAVKRVHVYPGRTYELAAVRRGEQLEVVKVRPRAHQPVVLEFDGDTWVIPEREGASP
jgi:hypothetical protein